MLLEGYLTITVFMFLLFILCICNDTKGVILPQLRGVWLFLGIVTFSFAWPLMIAILFVRAIVLSLVTNSETK